MQFIDLQKQYKKYQEEIDDAIRSVMSHGRYIMGPEVEKLENKLAKYVDVKFCIGTANGTDSLQIALMALDIGPGDEVITVPFTWISTAEVIKLVGADPVFVDIDPETYTMNIEQMEEAITPRTKAIIPVSLFGQMPDYERINKIAEKYHLPVIEDGAQSFGATQRGKKSCGATTIGSTSFFPAKPFGCYGDGGALFTNDDALAEKMQAIRLHGGKKRHHHTHIGMNSRLDTIQAAVLLAKFKYFPMEVEARKRIGKRYSLLLKDYCCIPKIEDGNTSVYAQYTIRIENRGELIHALKEKGIPSAVYYPKCLHEQEVFLSSKTAPKNFPEAEKAAGSVLSLPMHPYLEESEQDEVAKAVQESLSVLA